MTLSNEEAKFLATFSAAGKGVFSYQDAVEYFQSKETATNRLGRLFRKGWLQRLENGLYLIIPLEAGPERLWSENAYVLASNLISPSAIAYWSALRYWNMTEQIPQVYFIQTPKRKKSTVIQGIKFQFVHVEERYFFGILTQRLRGADISVTDREKTIIDIAHRPELGGGIIQLAEALKTAYNDIDWEKFDQYIERWGGGSVVKRLGYLIETMSIPIPDREAKLKNWRSLISKGISQLEPGSGKKGPVVTRWNLQINIPFETLHF